MFINLVLKYKLFKVETQRKSRGNKKTKFYLSIYIWIYMGIYMYMCMCIYIYSLLFYACLWLETWFGLLLLNLVITHYLHVKQVDVTIIFHILTHTQKNGLWIVFLFSGDPQLRGYFTWLFNNMNDKYVKRSKNITACIQNSKYPLGFWTFFSIK